MISIAEIFIKIPSSDWIITGKGKIYFTTQKKDKITT